MFYQINCSSTYASSLYNRHFCFSPTTRCTYILWMSTLQTQAYHGNPSVSLLLQATLLLMQSVYIKIPMEVSLVHSEFPPLVSKPLDPMLPFYVIQLFIKFCFIRYSHCYNQPRSPSVLILSPILYIIYISILSR